MDKVRLHREMLKRAWFSIPRDEDKVETREIRVISNDNNDWFIVKIITEQRNKENDGVNDYTKYKLVIN